MKLTCKWGGPQSASGQETGGLISTQPQSDNSGYIRATVTQRGALTCAGCGAAAVKPKVLSPLLPIPTLTDGVRQSSASSSIVSAFSRALCSCMSRDRNRANAVLWEWNKRPVLKLCIRLQRWSIYKLKSMSKPSCCSFKNKWSACSIQSFLINLPELIAGIFLLHQFSPNTWASSRGCCSPRPRHILLSLSLGVEYITARLGIGITLLIAP